MTRREAAEYLRVSMCTVDRMAMRRGWAVFKLDRRILVRRRDVIRSVKLHAKASEDNESAHSAEVEQAEQQAHNAVPKN